MKFEFDPAKSSSNNTKHGIDFERAKALWDDPEAIEFALLTDDEPRALVMGMIGEKLWSAIVTYREDRIRIISVRRSRESERKLYEG